MSGKFYYNSKKNVEDYIKMAEPYDGKILIDELIKNLKKGSSLLELGMGPGKDLDHLSGYFKVTGSDLSNIFIERYKKLNPRADVYQLDALTIDIDKKFDCIYSNKVLHHLDRTELEESLKRQLELLNPGGLVMHSFWEGDREEFLSGLRFIYYREKQLQGIFSKQFEYLTINSYSEMYQNDSLWVMGKKKTV